MNKFYGLLIGLFIIVLTGCSAAPQATMTATIALPSATLPPALPPLPTASATPSAPTGTATPAFIATPMPTETPGVMLPCSQVGQSWVSPVDGMTLLCVPAGEFLMGQDPAKEPNPQESTQPQHRVFLDAFWVDQTEVTNAMFALCAQAGVCDQPVNNPGFSDPQAGSAPVTGVTRENAIAYCEWAGRDLPSEAQWEKAARGTDGRLYPWGDEPIDCTRGNARRGSVGPSCANDVIMPVGSYPAGASPYGALDMVGNVSEMVLDQYSDDYYSRSPYRNPVNMEIAADEVLDWVMRGGSWYSMPYAFKAAGRDLTRGGTDSMTGFRCAYLDPSVAMQPTPTPPVLTRDLYLASPVMSGEDVFALQARLVELGYTLGAMDGVFGAKTDGAVRSFQKLNALAVDGWVGPKTWAVLFSPEARAFEYPAPTFTVAKRLDVFAPDYLEAVPGKVWVTSQGDLLVINTSTGQSRTLSMIVNMPMFKAGSKVWIPTVDNDGWGVLTGCALDGASCSTPVNFGNKPGFDLGASVFFGADASGYVWLVINGGLYAMPYDLSQPLNRLTGIGLIISIGFDDSRLWVANENSLKVLEGGNGTQLYTVDLPDVANFAYDGDVMWVLESRTRKILALAPESGEVLAGFQPCAGAHDIAFADGLLWVSCYDTDQVLGLQIEPLR
ncbi:MAG TPA: SUMF1/EgtB/PvdO family nonheme iron enzyme [Anaerolineaceae bacterium]|nr:SUMF1/EgtB/PvdO family nonheme iron enzyme [Anaerolineaceae bacterium]